MSDSDSDGEFDYHKLLAADNFEEANVEETVEEPKKESKKRKRVVVSDLDPEKLAEFNAAEKRKGIVYLARIPPFMKPIKIRHLLERHAEIGKIYLAPEDEATYRRRVKSGGNKKIKYTEGWVEFLDKRMARAVASLLHNQPVEDKKNSFYSSDLWNMKYLKHFKWNHLTERISYEKKIKAMALRQELTNAKKEAEKYIERAEQAHTIEEMEKKKSMKASQNSSGRDSEELSQIRRNFKQRQAIKDMSLE